MGSLQRQVAFFIFSMDLILVPIYLCMRKKLKTFLIASLFPGEVNEK